MSSSSILVINCGSSSLKFAVVEPLSATTGIEGLAENLNGKNPKISWKINHAKYEDSLSTATYEAALNYVAQLLKDQKQLNITGVGHRVVHGGEAFKQSTMITEEVIETIQQCIPLAPLHNPANLSGITVARHLFPHLSHVAVFDTAFHQSMPSHAYVYPLPYDLYQQYGVRRYGFHGTSHQYVTQQAAQQLNINYAESAFISAHLGNGCSIAAVRNGQSIDTSMGLTPLEGLMMGTRCGDIDPSLHQYIAKQCNLSLDQVTNILNKESGLLGVSGISFDMRQLEQAVKDGEQQAELAIKIFCYRLAKYIGAYAIALGRIDALIFTGGIGENSAFIRREVLQQLGILNFQLSPERNQQHGATSQGLITTKNSTNAIVVNTDEQLAIARETYAEVRIV